MARKTLKNIAKLPHDEWERILDGVHAWAVAIYSKTTRSGALEDEVTEESEWENGTDSDEELV